MKDLDSIIIIILVGSRNLETFDENKLMSGSDIMVQHDT